MEEIQLNNVEIIQIDAELSELDKNLKYLYKNNRNIINLISDEGFTNGLKEVNKLVLYKIVKQLVKFIEKIPNINGNQKKKLLIDFIIYVIRKDLNIEDSIKNNIIIALNEILPDLIDTIVELWQEVDWGIILNRLKKFCRCCCCKKNPK